MADTTSGLESRPSFLARTASSSDHPLAAPTGPFAIPQRRPGQIPPKRIGLLGVFGSGNSGNDGSLEAMLIFLRRVCPHAELKCFCQPSPGADALTSRDFGLPATPLAFPRPANGVLRILDDLSLQGPRRLASLVRAIWYVFRLDLLIVPGTGILGEFRNRQAGMHLALFGWCLAARLCGTKIAFVSVGAGPLHHPFSRWLVKSAAAMAHYRSYRDTISKAFMASIGVNAQDDPVYPDIAFKLPAPPLPHGPGDENGPTIVGVGVMTYKGWRIDTVNGSAIYAAYIEKITNFVLWLLDRGHTVRVLTGETTDWQAVTELASNVAVARPDLPQDRLLAVPMRSLHDLMRVIAQTDVVIASRFHNVVCALKLGKPTISIGYADKNDALMAEMGMKGFCQHIEHLDLDLLIEQFAQLMSDRQRYKQDLREANLVLQKRLDRQDLILVARLL